MDVKTVFGVFLAAAIALAIVFIAAGRTPVDKVVFVPAKNFKVSVEISAPDSERVGEWFELKASRRSGPWVEVPAWRAIFSWPRSHGPPSDYEPNVATNLLWRTDSDNVAEFDVGQVPIEIDPESRAARFKAPGEYRLWAISSYPARATSNVVTIAVSEQ